MGASRNPLVRLHHVRDEIVQLRGALVGSSFEVFSRSYVLRRTTEHAVLIISEAVKALPSSLTDAYPGIDWRAVRDIGNLLRHEYYEVDIRVLWSVAAHDLPELESVVRSMIEDHDPPPPSGT